MESPVAQGYGFGPGGIFLEVDFWVPKRGFGTGGREVLWDGGSFLVESAEGGAFDQAEGPGSEVDLWKGIGG